MKGKWFVPIFFILALSFGWSSAWAQGNVTITPLGVVNNEFCAADRALLFQDPTGVRILIAPGRTVGLVSGGSAVGSNDPRIAPIGSVHVLLIDHPHVDHVGDRRHTNCSSTASVPFAPPGDTETNAAEIAAIHKSAVLVGGELPDFFTQKIKNITGITPPGCPAAGLDNTLQVPVIVDIDPSPAVNLQNNSCVGVIRGGTRSVAFGGQPGVKITTIPAFHAAGASRAHVDELLSPSNTVVADPGIPAGLTGYAGAETGYIIRFTNGLTVLWTGDSGLIGDWETQAKFYKVNLAVVHGGDLFTMGPDEAAFAVNHLIKPQTVIPEHFNQVSTTGGVVNAGTRLERFISQLGGAKAIVPLSGVPIFCNGDGHCTQ